jgi:hypothetical protein
MGNIIYIRSGIAMGERSHRYEELSVPSALPISHCPPKGQVVQDSTAPPLNRSLQ